MQSSAISEEECSESVHLRKDFTPPSSHSGKNTWSEVSGRIDSIARIKAHSQSNDQNHKPYSEGLQALGDGVVVWIHNSQNTDNQRCCANDLH